jgi:large subunit ribosomal protein L21
MYAIIADSGKQFKVEEGQTIQVDYRDVHAGDQITFDKVLCVSGKDGAKLGEPTVDGATVTGEVVGVKQGPKLIVQKIRRRKNSRRRTGHRQLYTAVKIDNIKT